MTDWETTPEEEIASTMTDRYPPIKDCDTCNMHGPELPPSPSAFLDLHRASHDAAQAIAQPFIDFLERHARWMTECSKPCGDHDEGDRSMSEGTQWLNEITARLEAVKTEHPYENRDRDAEKSAAWSDLYQHAPTDLRRLIAEVERLETELANKETDS